MAHTNTVEMTIVYRFNSIGQALAYYRYCNPARAVYKNPLETESRKTRIAREFSGDHPSDVWASICLALQTVKESYTSSVQRILFDQMFGAESTKHITDVAKDLFISERIARKWHNKMFDEIERELTRRELIEFRD